MSEPSDRGRGDVDLADIISLLEQERSARVAAEEASRLKDEFLATVSHELRTPLNAMLGWASMLKSGSLDEAQSARAVDVIERSARTQAQLIEDLVDVSRVVAGSLRINVRAVDVAAFVEPAVDAVRPAAEAKGVLLTLAIDPDLGTIDGDATRLQQVVCNLLSNAIKFTPRGGHVDVAVRRVEPAIEISVADTGQGIGNEFLPHVFERFTRADGSTTRRQGGLGLGLAIARHLIELHGGTVSAESDGEQRGARFVVRLPVAAARQQAATQDAPRPAAASSEVHVELPSLAGIRILVVDDDPDARALVDVVLARCGAVVETAGSAAEALAILEPNPPDIVVSDIGMPDEDGYAFMRKVRALPAERGGHVPAIALTAYIRSEDRLLALGAGYQTHIPKPVEPEELAFIIRDLVARAKETQNRPR